jgi:hypothetical protein
MNKLNKSGFAILLLLALFACTDEEIDDVRPTIDLSLEDAFPLNCDTIYFGESFEMRMLFSDNCELGSFSISVHNNFNHHSHSTEVTECNLSPVKDPVNPLNFIEDFSIPEGMTEYETDFAVNFPSGDENGDFDEGDYHFFISLTDKEGSSEQKGLSIKILHR